MRITISVPDDLLARAERLARRMKKSRSQLLGEAIRDYMARHSSDDLTDLMDRVIANVGSGRDEFGSLAVRRVLARSEW
jgi:metal-responsive CopG/Arc/MetJ family transcriptional regulator